ELIDRKPTIREMYVRRLVGLGQITEETAQQITERRRGDLKQALDEVKQHGFSPASRAMGGVWQLYKRGVDADDQEVDTAVGADVLIELSKKVTTLPDDFTPHRKIKSLLDTRHKRLAEGQGLDWGTVEILAYASLLAEGTPIRISG